MVHELSVINDPDLPSHPVQRAVISLGDVLDSVTECEEDEHTLGGERILAAGKD